MAYTIAFVVPGMAFAGDALDKQSLGGSETAALHMARELSRLGHKVTVFSHNNGPRIYSGVTYYPADYWHSWTTTVPHDFSIVQRTLNAFTTPRLSKRNILWCHDQLPADRAEILKTELWSMHGIFVLSERMAKDYAIALAPPPGMLWITANGVDKKYVDAVPPAGPRDPYHLFNSSRPERGVDNLLADIMPRVLAKEPRARLSLASYDFSQEKYADFYDRCDNLAAALGDRVTKLGALSKRQLYAQMKTASLYAYPTPSLIWPDFEEVSCISVMEARACGLGVVTTPNGALSETVPEATFVPGVTWSAEFADAFADAVLTSFGKPVPQANVRDWADIARSWTGKFADMLAAGPS